MAKFQNVNRAKHGGRQFGTPTPAVYALDDKKSFERAFEQAFKDALSEASRSRSLKRNHLSGANTHSV
jgi:hypothetical protein